MKMIFSSMYLAHHSNHSCSEAECPICATMEKCANNLRNLGITTTIMVVFGLQELCKTEVDSTITYYCSSRNKEGDSISYWQRWNS